MEESPVDLYISRVENAIRKAESYDTKIRPHALQMVGMSGLKNRIFMNEMVHADTRYLEVGVWLGSTFVSALYKNTWDYAVAIDDFSELGGQQEQFIDNCQTNIIRDYNDGKSFCFINANCFKLSDTQKDLIKDINVYFYDGGHSQLEQYDALAMYKSMMAKTFIYIVDDWNHKPAQVGTRDAIKNLGLKVHKEWEIFNPVPTVDDDYFNWWNGFYVAILEKP